MRIKQSELLELINECLVECACNGQIDVEILKSPKVDIVSNNLMNNVLKSLNGKKISHNYQVEEDEEETDRFEYENEEEDDDNNGRMLDYGHVKSDSEEGRMTRQNLYTIKKHAKELCDLIQDNDDLPEWVQEKVAMAKEHIQTVSNYLSYKLNDMMDEEDDD